VALTVIVAMRIVGALLTSALIVIPAVTALRLARSFRSTLAIAIGVALVAVIVGMTAAFYLDVAAGGAIVVCAILLFALSTVVTRRL
jgi:zinc transport system permease protein